MNVLACHLKDQPGKVLARAVPASAFYLLVELDDVCYEGAPALS